MVADQPLTEAEARVLWTALRNSYAPGQYYTTFISALHKLCVLGKGYACRDCPELGRFSSRYGGFVCKAHKEQEDTRQVNPGGSK